MVPARTTVQQQQHTPRVNTWTTTKKWRHFRGTYVQNNASRTETIGKSSYPPPIGKTDGAERPRPMCPAGLHVSERLLFCRKVLVRREKLAKVRNFDKHNTYTYIYRSLWMIKRKTYFAVGMNKYSDRICRYTTRTLYVVGCVCSSH